MLQTDLRLRNPAPGGAVYRDVQMGEIEMLNARSVEDYEATDIAAGKIEEIRAVLASGASDVQEQLRQIGAIVDRDQPASHEIYQKPWG